MRYPAFDFLRSFAMVLGVFFHAALSYVPINLGQVIQDNTTTQLMYYFVDISHSFRMHLFFVMSGFFSSMLLAKSGLKKLYPNRFKKIVIPFIATYLTISPALGYFYKSTGVLTGLAIIPGHLWFLYYLCYFYAVIGLTDKFAARLGEKFKQPHILHLFLLILLSALPMYYMQIPGLVDEPSKTFMPLPATLLFYFSFFFSGQVLFHMKNNLAKITKMPIVLCIVLFAVSYYGKRYLIDTDNYSFIALTSSAVSWTLVFSFIILGIRLFTQDKPLLRYFSDTSYWLYLVHLIFVIPMQISFANIDLPWPLEFTIISLASLALCFVSYRYLVRYTLIGRYLHGVRNRDA
jgi:glucan biosynthesis protein C